MFRSLRKAAETLERNIDTAFSTDSGEDGGYAHKEFEIGGQRVKLGPVFATGGFSFVHSARPAGTDSSCTTRFAVKRMSVADAEGEELAQREIDVLTALPEHRNIVRFLGATVQTPSALLMFELLDGGTLQEVLERRRGVPSSQEEILAIFHDAVAAVTHLHAQSPPIACRDVKLENLLYDRLGGTFKLCDLGSCTTVAGRYTTRQEMLAAEDDIASNCSAMYRAPEMVDLYTKQFICERIDVWALGCIFFALLYGSLPFDGASSMPILKAAYEPPPGAPQYPDAFIKLLAAMLCADPARRADSFTVLEAVCRLRGIEMDPGLRVTGARLRNKRAADFASAGSSVPLPKPSSKPVAKAEAARMPHQNTYIAGASQVPAQNAFSESPSGDGGGEWADFDSAFDEAAPPAALPVRTMAPKPVPRPAASVPTAISSPPFLQTAKTQSTSSAPEPVRRSPWSGTPAPAPAPTPVPSTANFGKGLDLGALYGQTGRIQPSVVRSKPEASAGHAFRPRERGGDERVDLSALCGRTSGLPHRSKQEPNAAKATSGHAMSQAPNGPQPGPVRKPLSKGGIDLSALYGTQGSIQPVATAQLNVEQTSQPAAFGVRPGGQALDLAALYGGSNEMGTGAAQAGALAENTKEDKDAFADLSALAFGLGSANRKHT